MYQSNFWPPQILISNGAGKEEYACLTNKMTTIPLSGLQEPFLPPNGYTVQTNLDKEMQINLLYSL